MPQARQNPQNTRQIVLMITNACNLKCKYCYESFKTNTYMSCELARGIIQREFELSITNDRSQFIMIDFLGGEPLMNFELISSITDWLYSCKWPRHFELNVRTNGTLLDETMKCWFLQNREKINLALSLDGLGEMQYLNRTQKNIDAKFFIDHWPNQKIKIVIFKDTVKYLYDAVISLKNQEAAFQFDIGCGFEWTSESAKELEAQLIRLIPFYVGNIDSAIDTGLFKYSVANFYPKKTIREYPFCGNMTNIIAYDVDGQSYCCHMFTPSVVGTTKAKISQAFLAQNRMIPVDKICQECPIFLECKLCYAQNLKVCGDINKSAARLTTCRAVKAMARASARLFLENLHLRMKMGKKIFNSDYSLGQKAMRILDEIVIS